MNILLEPTTAAVETAPFEFDIGTDRKFGHRIPVTLYTLGTIGAAVISLEYYDGFQWLGFKRANTTIQLDATNSVIVIDYPLKFRLKKHPTTTKVGVGVSSIVGQFPIETRFEGYLVLENGNHLITEDESKIVQNNS